MPSKTAQWGKDYKNIVVAVTPEEHYAAKRNALEHGVPISELVRMALQDETLWKRAAREKAKRDA